MRAYGLLAGGLVLMGVVSCLRGVREVTLTAREDEPARAHTFGELNPYGPKDVGGDDAFFERGLPRDCIRPIYDRVITRTAEARLDTDELVIGVSLGDERIINDRIGEYPVAILVDPDTSEIKV